MDKSKDNPKQQEHPQPLGNVDLCVICGRYVVEGRQVCTDCENKEKDAATRFDKNCKEDTNT